MKKIFLTSILPLFLLSLQPGCESTQEKESSGWIRGEGMAQIYQNDLSLAKDRAIRAAKKDAIARKLGEMIESKSIIDSGVWVKGEISAKAEGLVKEYKIKSERSQDGIYYITISAYVEPADLKNSVESMLQQWEKPVILAIISESFDSKKNGLYDNSTISSISQYYLEKGFSVNRKSSWQKRLSHPVEIEDVMDLSNTYSPDFDLLVFGNTNCENNGNIMDSKLISAQIDLSISILDVNTGDLIATRQAHAAAAHINFSTACRTAIEKAVTSIQDNLFSQMVQKWKKEYASGKTIVLEIKGALDYDSTYRLENEIKNSFRGVVDLFEKSIQPSRKILHIVYTGQTRDFMEELKHKRLSVKLTVEKRQGNLVTVTVR